MNGQRNERTAGTAAGIKRVPKEYDKESEFTVSELLGAFDWTSYDGVDIRWERFFANYYDKRNSFENLCLSLFRNEYFNKDVCFKKLPNNPGVEVHPEIATKGILAGKKVSFQAKCFDGPINYPDIKDSVRNTLKKYCENCDRDRQIEAIVLYCNKSISQSYTGSAAKGNSTFEETKKMLEDAGVLLYVYSGDELLERIQHYPEIKKQFFFI